MSQSYIYKISAHSNINTIKYRFVPKYSMESLLSIMKYFINYTSFNHSK